MSDLPHAVLIREEGPREGFQSEGVLPVDAKVRLIESLAATGLRHITCVSFVHPDKLPQAADAEEVARSIRRRPEVTYSGLWLNARGFERALRSGLAIVPHIMVSVSDQMARKNNGCSAEDMLRNQGLLLDRYRETGYPLDSALLGTAFGCNYEGSIGTGQAMKRLDQMMALCRDKGLPPSVLYLCDTVGMATPRAVEALIGAVRTRWPDQKLGMHLHDTRGMGLANAYAALRLGVDQFDASCGGLGGCPFSGSGGASGNICTEDLALMCEEMGIHTGLDIEALVESARIAEEVVGHPLPGRVMKAGRIRRANAVAEARP